MECHICGNPHIKEICEACERPVCHDCIGQEDVCSACWADYEEHGLDDCPGEDMDGDHESALASAGFGTDEDYGCYGGGEEW